MNLDEVLRLVEENQGSEAGLIEALRARYFSEAAAARQNPDERLGQQRARARNVLIGLRSYGLVDSDTIALSEVGTKVRNATGDAERYQIFARHVFEKCAGKDVLEAVRDLQKRRERVTKRTLQLQLKRRGFDMQVATTAHQTVLNWLALAGVISGGYSIDPSRFAVVAGLALEMVDEIDALTREQRAFLQTLRGLAAAEGTNALLTKDVYRAAIIQHGEIFPEDQLSKKLLRPLAQKGWITLDAQGGGRGRGSRSGRVAATDKLLELQSSKLAPPPEEDIPTELRPLLNTPLETIYADLGSADTYKKGIALELLALRIVIHLGLHPKGFRLRSQQTGGSEVDLVADGAHLHFSRWVLQCKNTADVHLSALDKEIGMAVRTRAHVIVLVTTGRFSRAVEEAARELARDGHLQVVQINGETLKKYRELGMRYLLEFFESQAAETMRLKKEQLRTPSG